MCEGDNDKQKTDAFPHDSLSWLPYSGDCVSPDLPEDHQMKGEGFWEEAAPFSKS